MKNEQRWLQRLQNLNKAHKRLERACDQPAYNELETAGLVQTFEFTFELCWKTLKDKLLFEGYEVNSPREVIKKAFEMALIEDAQEWLEALETRNLFNHTYEDELARQAIDLIQHKYASMVRRCINKLNALATTS